MVFLPAVDGDVLPEQPLDAVARGAAARIPLLTGTTLDEWKLFGWSTAASAASMQRGPAAARLAERAAAGDDARARRAPSAARGYREALARARRVARRRFEVWCAFQSARVFHAPRRGSPRRSTRAGGSVHAYLFTWRTPLLRRALGACHAIERALRVRQRSSPLRGRSRA